MQQNRDTEKPCVGIFWYNPRQNNLFRVIKKHTDECKQTGNITCSELHKYIWKKEFNIQKFKNNGVRGRIFYNVDEGKYIVCVGSWIKDYPDAIGLIADEFHLNEVEYDFKIEQHWEIGCGWGD